MTGAWPALPRSVAGWPSIFLNDLGLAKLSIKATILGPVIIGALIFGLGLSGLLPRHVHGSTAAG